jgi:hypothetical protein
MMEKALFITKLFLDGWEKLCWYHSLLMAVFLGKIVSELRHGKEFPCWSVPGIYSLGT